jgi:hypothetical protein
MTKVLRVTTGLAGSNLDDVLAGLEAQPARTPASWEPVAPKPTKKTPAELAALSAGRAAPPPSMRSAILKQRKAEAVAAHRKGDDREERSVTATSAQDNLRAAMQSRIPEVK